MSVQTDRFGRIVPVNCYNSEHLVSKGEIVIANMTDFSLTRGRIYVVQNAGMFVEVINDEGTLEQYSYEYFDLYQGQKIVNY